MADAATLDLVRATWGLLIATVLLVIAGFIPPIQAAVQNARNTKRLAADIIPEMHLMKGRLDAMAKRCQEGQLRSPEKLARVNERIELDLEANARVMNNGAPEFGIHFMNELYVLRHLLTQAKIHTNKIIALAATGRAEEHQLVDFEKHVWRQYLAARTTLAAAESRIPSWARKISGETFWNRFSRVSADRELEADKEIIEHLHEMK